MSGDKAMKNTLLDEFEIKGYWRIPNTDEEVAGILFYKHEKITLELMGSFGDEIIFDLSKSKYDTIFGFSDKGEKFSLYNVQLFKSPSHFPGFMTQSFIVRELIVGGHFEDKNKIKFHSMIFYPTYLAEWIGRSHYKKIYNEVENRTYLKGIEWEDASNFSVYITEKEFQIEEVDSGDIKFSPQKIEWKNTTGFKITPKDFMDLKWFSGVMNALRILLATFINKPIFETSIVFYGEYDTAWDDDEIMIRHKYMYFFRSGKMNVDENFNPQKSLIKFKDIENNISNIIYNWFKFRDNHKVVLELYSEEFYKPIYVDSSFLSYVQALEIYHNKNTGQRYTKLEKRLTELFSDMKNESLEFLIGTETDKLKLISHLVDTRNYLTHFDMGTKRNVIFDSNDKFYITMMLKGILAFIIFKDLGIDEDSIVIRFSEDLALSQRISQGKEFLKRAIT